MKISIDTSTDSKEDIRKAIKLLQSIVEHDAAQGSRNIFDSPSADLFGNAPAQSQPTQQSNPVSAFGSLFSDDNQSVPTETQSQLKKEEQPEIEFY